MAKRDSTNEAARKTLVVLTTAFYVIALYHVYVVSGISDLLALIAAIAVFVTIDLEDKELSGVEVLMISLIAVAVLPLYLYLSHHKED